MSAKDRRAHPRYPAWLPINVRLDGEGKPLPAMLCDVSEGGALVWGFWSEHACETAELDVTFHSTRVMIPARVVSVEVQWDTVVLHLQFAPDLFKSSPPLAKLLAELRGHFEAYQVYLAHRADDDPALGRTATQYPAERASA
jgi:hypothetical protein